MLRSPRVPVALAAVLAVSAIGAGTVGAKTSKKGKADSGTVYASTTHTAGGNEYVAGNGTDKLFGATAVTYVIKVSSVPTQPGTFNLTAQPVTTWTSTGSLTGTGSATLTIGAGGAATITNGKLTEKKGSGKQKGHSFVGTFTGTGSVTTGVYTFHFKGTYK